MCNVNHFPPEEKESEMFRIQKETDDYIDDVRQGFKTKQILDYWLKPRNENFVHIVAEDAIRSAQDECFQLTKNDKAKSIELYQNIKRFLKEALIEDIATAAYFMANINNQECDDLAMSKIINEDFLIEHIYNLKDRLVEECIWIVLA